MWHGLVLSLFHKFSTFFYISVVREVCYAPRKAVQSAIWRSQLALSPMLDLAKLCLQIVLQDDHLAMLVQNTNERDAILGVVWLSATEQVELTKYVDASPLLVWHSDCAVLFQECLPTQSTMVTKLLSLLSRCTCLTSKFHVCADSICRYGASYKNSINS